VPLFLPDDVFIHAEGAVVETFKEAQERKFDPAEYQRVFYLTDGVPEQFYDLDFMGTQVTAYG
jgi:hypothetical protein